MIGAYIFLVLGLGCVGANRMLMLKEKATITEKRIKQLTYLQYLGYGLCVLAVVSAIVWK